MKRKVGVWLKHGYSPSKGGGFSYYDALLHALATNKKNSDVEICLVSPAQEAPRIDGLECVCLGLLPNKVPLIKVLTLNHRWAKLILIVTSRLFKQRWQSKLKKAGVSLVYYTTQGEFVLSDFPFITTIWDMGYFVTYPFPELVRGNNFKGRRATYTDILPKALMVFCESEAGKNALVKYANICEEKIRVLPIFAGNVVNLKVTDTEQAQILVKHGLKKNNYFFYPAQFWAHKNHITILKAFVEFLPAHTDYRLVFTGGNKGNLMYVKSVCEELKLTKNVLFLGFVDNEELFTFYKNATAIVMASYFGPTNMPPIEAMHLSCPVICSDIEGHREILGDAALYFNANESKQLTNAMYTIHEKHEAYRKLLDQRLKSSKFTIGYTIRKMQEYLSEAVVVRNNWE